MLLPCSCGNTGDINTNVVSGMTTNWSNITMNSRQTQKRHHKRLRYQINNTQKNNVDHFVLVLSSSSLFLFHIIQIIILYSETSTVVVSSFPLLSRWTWSHRMCSSFSTTTTGLGWKRHHDDNDWFHQRRHKQQYTTTTSRVRKAYQLHHHMPKHSQHQQFANYGKRIFSWRIILSTKDNDDDDNDDNTNKNSLDSKRNHDTNNRLTTGGLYQPYADRCWIQLKLYMKQYPYHEYNESMNDDYSNLVSYYKNKSYHDDNTNGLTTTTTIEERVKITMKSIIPTIKNNNNNNPNVTCPIRYARYALIETITNTTTNTTATRNDDDHDNMLSTSTISYTDGIQVLNMIIIPNDDDDNSNKRPLPVWGADFVSLPNDKHLLLLDAQPMMKDADDTYAKLWDDWYESQYHIEKTYPWGGTLPEEVQQYVSHNALWTRMTSTNTTTPVEVIQSSLFHDMIQDHLSIYLDLVFGKNTITGSQSEALQQPQQQHDYRHNSQQMSYLQYRYQNDPARPMLNRLYGKNYTEYILQKILFPQWLMT